MLSLILYLQNLKFRRSVEFKENEIQQLQERLNKQDEHINKLEEELLKCFQISQDIFTDPSTSPEGLPETPTEPKQYVANETQTSDIANPDVNHQDKINKLQLNVLEREKEISIKNNEITQLQNRITELEMNISLFKQQINDKQSQIMFYENHIMELRGKIEQTEKIPIDNNSAMQRNEEALMLNVIFLIKFCIFISYSLRVLGDNQPLTGNAKTEGRNCFKLSNADQKR